MSGAVGPPIVGNYQTVQTDFVALPGQPALNFLPPLKAANDGANASTDVSTTQIQYGTNAALPSQPVAQYTLYLATDNGAIYVSSGSAWLQILGPA
jgi:hypothetical protein